MGPRPTDAHWAAGKYMTYDATVVQECAVSYLSQTAQILKLNRRQFISLPKLYVGVYNSNASSHYLWEPWPCKCWGCRISLLTGASYFSCLWRCTRNSLPFPTYFHPCTSPQSQTHLEAHLIKKSCENWNEAWLIDKSFSLPNLIYSCCWGSFHPMVNNSTSSSNDSSN